MVKGLKSYVKAILGETDLEKFNDFEKGVVFMERSRLEQHLPPRVDFLAALEFAKDGVENLKDYSSEVPNIIREVGKLSIELLELQIEILDKFPEEKNWTYRKSMEFTRDDEDLCDRLDFLAGKLYQLMPIYSKTLEEEMIKNAEKEMESRKILEGLKNINEGDPIN